MTRRRWSVVLLLLGLPLLVLGFVASFGVELAYLTSHGSAWLSPARERLRVQWFAGRALVLAAGAAFAGSILLGLAARTRSWREVWWVLLSAAGLALFVLDLAWLGIRR